MKEYEITSIKANNKEEAIRIIKNKLPEIKIIECEKTKPKGYFRIRFLSNKNYG